MNKLTIKSLLPLILLFSISNAQTLTYSIDELSKNPNLYLSTITQIVLSSNNRTLLKGEKHAEKFITGALLKSVLCNINQNDFYPECFIDHTVEETDAYFSFADAFKMRSMGLDGGLLVMKWHRAGFKQKVCFNNIDKNTVFAASLLESDIYLKEMVLGSKHTKVFGMPSFVTYVESEMSKNLENNESVSGSGYESIFYLLPDTIQISVSGDSSYTINNMKFKLVPNELHKAGTPRKIEIDWADIFNKNYTKITDKHGELRKLTEIFKIYLVLKLYAKKDYISKYSTNDSPVRTPDELESIKYSDYIETPAPFINHPGRMRFLWILISGGISFDFANTVIIRNAIE